MKPAADLPNPYAPPGAAVQDVSPRTRARVVATTLLLAALFHAAWAAYLMPSLWELASNMSISPMNFIGECVAEVIFLFSAFKLRFGKTSPRKLLLTITVFCVLVLYGWRRELLALPLWFAAYPVTRLIIVIACLVWSKAVGEGPKSDTGAALDPLGTPVD